MTTIGTSSVVLCIENITAGLDLFGTVRVVSALRLCSSGMCSSSIPPFKKRNRLTVVCTAPTMRMDLCRKFNEILLFSTGADRNNSAASCQAHPKASSSMYIESDQPIYYGPVDEMLRSFFNLGYDCPESANPIDYFMDITSATPAVCKVCTDKYEQSCGERRNYQLSEEERKNLRRISPAEDPSYLTYFSLLVQREFYYVTRAPGGKVQWLIEPLLFGVLIMLIFWQLGDESLKGSLSRIGLLFTVVALRTIVTAPSDIASRIACCRQWKEGDCSAGTFACYYLLVQIAFTACRQVVQTLLFVLPIYFGCNLGPQQGNLGSTGVALGFLAAVVFCVEFASSGACWFFVFSTERYLQAVSLANAHSVLLCLSGGYLISTGSLQANKKLFWLSAINYMHYAYRILLSNECRYIECSTDQFSLTAFPDDAWSDTWQSWFPLIIIGLVYHILALCAIYFKYRYKTTIPLMISCLLKRCCSIAARWTCRTSLASAGGLYLRSNVDGAEYNKLSTKMGHVAPIADSDHSKAKQEETDHSGEQRIDDGMNVEIFQSFDDQSELDDTSGRKTRLPRDVGPANKDKDDDDDDELLTMPISTNTHLKPVMTPKKFSDAKNLAMVSPGSSSSSVERVRAAAVAPLPVHAASSDLSTAYALDSPGKGSVGGTARTYKNSSQSSVNQAAINAAVAAVSDYSNATTEELRQLIRANTGRTHDDNGVEIISLAAVSSASRDESEIRSYDHSCDEAISRADSEDNSVNNAEEGVCCLTSSHLQKHNNSSAPPKNHAKEEELSFSGRNDDNDVGVPAKTGDSEEPVDGSMAPVATPITVSLDSLTLSVSRRSLWGHELRVGTRRGADIVRNSLSKCFEIPMDFVKNRVCPYSQKDMSSDNSSTDEFVSSHAAMMAAMVGVQNRPSVHKARKSHNTTSSFNIHTVQRTTSSSHAAAHLLQETDTQNSAALSNRSSGSVRSISSRSSGLASPQSGPSPVSSGRISPEPDSKTDAEKNGPQRRDSGSNGYKQPFKKLLTNINGYMIPGNITVVIGGSGAGKTVLLDLLSNTIPLQCLRSKPNTTTPEVEYSRENSFHETRLTREPHACVRMSKAFSTLVSTARQSFIQPAKNLICEACDRSNYTEYKGSGGVLFNAMLPNAGDIISNVGYVRAGDDYTHMVEFTPREVLLFHVKMRPLVLHSHVRKVVIAGVTQFSGKVENLSAEVLPIAQALHVEHMLKVVGLQHVADCRIGSCMWDKRGAESILAAKAEIATSPSSYGNSGKNSSLASILSRTDSNQYLNSNQDTTTSGPPSPPQNCHIGVAELRRLSLAVQILGDPALCLWDDAFMGLDAEQSRQLLNTLRKMCERECTVVLTMQSPRYDIFDNIDDCILLASGIQLWAGPTRSMHSFFQKLHLPCPTLMNPADFYLDLSCTDHENALADDKSRRQLKQVAAQFEAYFKHLENKNPYSPEKKQPVAGSFFCRRRELNTIGENKAYFSKLSHLSRSFFGSFRKSMRAGASSRHLFRERHHAASHLPAVSLWSAMVYLVSREVISNWRSPNGLLHRCFDALLFSVAIFAFFSTVPVESSKDPNDIMDHNTMEIDFPSLQNRVGLVNALIAGAILLGLHGCMCTLPNKVLIMRRDSAWQWARIDLLFPAYQLSTLPATLFSAAIVTVITLFTVIEETPSLKACSTIFFVLCCCQIFGECLGLFAVLNTEYFPPAAFAIHRVTVPLQAQCGFKSAMDHATTIPPDSAAHGTKSGQSGVHDTKDLSSSPFNTTIPRKRRRLFSPSMGLGGWSSICSAVAVLSGECNRIVPYKFV